jgi:hypothetical protein
MEDDHLSRNARGLVFNLDGWLPHLLQEQDSALTYHSNWCWMESRRLCRLSWCRHVKLYWCHYDLPPDGAYHSRCSWVLFVAVSAPLFVNRNYMDHF